jgi:prolyl-tRNA synthetase
MVMGCYGIGVTRTLQAAIEQCHDQHGIVWPLAIAPYRILLCELDPGDKKVRSLCQKLYDRFVKQGWDVLWDDREERPGVKFKDADLIGIPFRVTVGAKSLAQGGIEIKARAEKDFQRIDPKDAVQTLKKLGIE